MKKIIMSLSIISTVWFIGCGGGSEEAKELLQRLLKVVGIPHTIVANICQDGNDNGICEEFEIQAKITIDKGDTLATILHKVSLTDEGEYFLENYDPTKKIIMEIEDSANVNYNDGKFAFTYNPETQELSILQAIIDAGYLTPNDVNAVREMNNVDDFYEVLLRDFESNLNTLGDNDFSSPRAVSANIKEMADELLANGIVDTLPQSINDCNGSQTCVDNVLAPVSEELLIDENESVIIKEEETKTTKELFAGKTFYSYYSVDNEEKIAEIIVNDEANSWSYQEIVGGDSHGNIAIEIDGDKITIYNNNEDNPERKSVIARDKYIAIGTDKKFFYTKADADALINTDNTTDIHSLDFSNIGSHPTALHSPNGGEIWDSGKNQTIEWDINQLNGSNIDIYVLHDDPSNLTNVSSSLNETLSNKRWYQFADDISNTGVYNVDPIDLNGDGNAYVILIVSANQNWDVSNSTMVLNR
ncbi:MAG: GPI anchored serine-threonine rich family protein [Epsilonproteobacteria bacterium]|nr:GPI anchored serine-threonine rich family protein [Campylobacterota bacterium]